MFLRKTGMVLRHFQNAFQRFFHSLSFGCRGPFHTNFINHQVSCNRGKRDSINQLSGMCRHRVSPKEQGSRSMVILGFIFILSMEPRRGRVCIPFSEYGLPKTRLRGGTHQPRKAVSYAHPQFFILPAVV